MSNQFNAVNIVHSIEAHMNRCHSQINLAPVYRNRAAASEMTNVLVCRGLDLPQARTISQTYENGLAEVKNLDFHIHLAVVEKALGGIG